MSIHCATDCLSRDVVLGAIQDEDQVNINIKTNVAAIYFGVDFLNLLGAHGNTDLTGAVADNLAAAIEIE
jgi:hypothetical protein|tara:strand:- start:503 stop:712 length:210 start_codon:yes stop_codon:yes gene_type:complete